MSLKFTKKITVTFLISIFVLLSSCGHYPWTSSNAERNPAETKVKIDVAHTPLRIKRAEFEKALQLATDFLTHPMSREVVRMGLTPRDNGLEDASKSFAISEKAKKAILETQCVELIATNPDFKNFVLQFVSEGKAVSDNKSVAAKEFGKKQIEAFKKVDLGPTFAEYSGFRPLPVILTDAPAGYDNVKMFATHDRFSPTGELIKAQDLVKEVKTFIAGAESDITLNVFEFDIEEIAQELVKAKSRGVTVKLGIDANIIKERESVRKVYEYLKGQGVDAHPVESVGLNHQKIIVRDAKLPGKSKVLLSSANFTKSDMHPNGDLGDLPYKHPNSVPNANHLMIVDSDALALIAQNELQKTLVRKLKGDKYPLSGSFQVMGPGGNPMKPPYLVMAFTPRGGLGNVNSNLIAHAIRRNCSEKIFMAQFAFSSVSAMEAIMNCVKSRKERGLPTKLISVGDTPFAMQDWSMFLKMSGLDQKIDDATGLKFYEIDEASKFRELFESEADFEDFVKGMKIGPEVYSTTHAEFGGRKIELVAKIHHKSLSTGDMAIIGTSFNFSEAAETNQEQFFVFVDKKLAGEYQGMVTHLHQQSKRSVWDEAQRRNEVRRKSFAEIKKVVLEMTQNLSKGQELESSKKLMRRLVALTSEDEAVGILNKALLKFKNDGHGSLNFAFDWDDNVFYTKTKVIIYDKSTGEPKEVSTHDWVRAKNLIGLEGTEYENYEIRPDSYNNFRDKDANGSNFITDVLEAIDEDEGKMHWKGPAWDSFVLACSNEKTANQTTIITARGHEPKTVHRALLELKKRGMIQFVPPVENLWTVTNSNFSGNFQKTFGKVAQAGSVSSPSAAKAEVMKELLDRISKRNLSKEASGDGEFKFLASDGKTYSPGHLWGFSDDDYDNIKKAHEVLQPEVDKGRWPNVKITIMYTGAGHADVKNRLLVLRKGAPPRAASPLEFLEWRQAMAATNSPTNSDCFSLVESFFKAF